jgi:hypothetical protein
MACTGSGVRVPSAPRSLCGSGRCESARNDLGANLRHILRNATAAAIRSGVLGRSGRDSRHEPFDLSRAERGLRPRGRQADVGEVLARHGYDAPTEATLVDLTAGLYRALHPFPPHSSSPPSDHPGPTRTTNSVLSSERPNRVPDTSIGSRASCTAEMAVRECSGGRRHRGDAVVAPGEADADV